MGRKRDGKKPACRRIGYFVYAGDIHPDLDPIALLMAFSLFKKWQHSGMQLIITGNKSSSAESLTEKLATYKYRKDVHLILNPSKKTFYELIAGAYAFVYPMPGDHFPLTILMALRSGIPVIAYDMPLVREVAGDTIIYASAGADGLSAKMQSIYKDESLRAAVIDSAEEHIAQKAKTDIPQSLYYIFHDICQSKS
jgi:glycosyltransferase involved in cell wall biosynthesis